ncbi:hypothetical protein U1Q18_021877 [Sarracenia purpurea var. burkii]
MGDDYLTREDFKNIVWKPNLSRIDCLVVVSEVALEKYEIERARVGRLEHPIPVANPGARAKGKRSSRKKSESSKNRLLTFRVVHSSKVDVETLPLMRQTLPLVRKIQTVRPNRLLLCDSEYGRKNKKIKKTIKEKVKLDPLPLPPPELPAQFRERIKEMGGYEVALVIQKYLYASDEVPGIEALLIEPSCTTDCTVSIKKWEMPKKSGNVSSTYNLVSAWSSVVARNALKEHNIVQLWAFRVKSKLCFALMKVGGGDRDGGGGISVSSSNSSGSSGNSSSSDDSGFSGAVESSITREILGRKNKMT